MDSTRETLRSFTSQGGKSYLQSDNLIKYKRIKWTPNGKALHLLPGGKCLQVESEILIKYKNQMDP